MEEGQPLTHADVERIIELAEEGGFSFVRLESDGVEVTLMRDGYAPPSPGAVGAVELAGAPVPPPMAPPPPSTRASAPPAPEPAAAPRAQQPAPPAQQAAADATGNPAAEPGTVLVAPMIGIVFLAPNPAAEPYVQVGQAVAAGDTVALIEVMKMFTPVQADSAGVVRAVLVEDGQHVERGQPLVRLGN